MLMAEVRAEQLMRGIESRVRESLTPEQEAAIRAAAGSKVWERHPVDVGFSLPLPTGLCYVRVIAGSEKRSQARREVDRRRRPLAKRGNFVFLAGAALACGLLAVCLALLAGGF